ncbi:MAG: hypothetical protein NZ580_02830 [Bacteroidia bacterium]|nr:hypothetical protein [Bacteroidia bacterium]MDW8235720.1 CpsB/CapC family capsule biosynthesis tyrosine phosphatase [Bacteroidia bacterium]
MWFFSKKTIPIPLAVEIVVEVHNHVLPGVDDGAATMQEALQMMFFWAEMGYQKVVATPHQNTYMNPTTEQIETSYQKLTSQIQEQEIPIFLTTAAEYLIEPELKDRIPHLRTFGPKRYVLVELDFWHLPVWWERILFDLQAAEYTPVLAHPERYEYADRELLRKWYERGLPLQINLLSLANAYGKKAVHAAEYLLEKGWVSFVGSDMHRPAQIPAVREALQHKLLRKRLSSFLNPTLL